MLNTEREKNVQSQSLCFPGPVKKRTGSAKLLKDETSPQRRRIYSEEKAKIVAAFWGAVVAQAVLHQADMKKRMNFTRMI